MRFFGRAPKVSTDEKRVDELLSRGVVEVIVAEDLRKKLLSGQQLRIKLGIDPTSPNLHLGRSVPLLKLRDFQELGHQVVFIVGDFTGVIGDTSDKESERPMLERETIEQNKKAYLDQVGKLIDLSSAEFHYNSEWLEKLTYRDVGEHADQFSLTEFISRENIKRRLDAGTRVSLRELLYPLMQGYDSVAVRADVELGSTDQKFNLLAGRTLQERFKQAPQNLVITGPIIPGLDGRKMSSSWGNTINFSDAPADMYGKVMSMPDEQVATYFELCTRVPMEEVAEIVKDHPRDAKARLAKEIVALYHGVQAAQKAQDGFMQPDEAQEATVEQGTMLRDIAPTLNLSMSELRRLVQQGAIEEVDGTKVSSVDAVLKEGALKIGKHRFLKITFK